MSQHGRQSDRNAVDLPSRLIELRTFACFPVSQHRGFYFPPAAGWSPSLSREGNNLYSSYQLAFSFLTYTAKTGIPPYNLSSCLGARL